MNVSLPAKRQASLPLLGTADAVPRVRLEQAEDFLAAVRLFSLNGERTNEIELGGLRYLVNEFWTSGQRQAHSVHEISYRACFKPQLPQFFIERLTDPGDIVYDPFSGRGTTAIQAALMRRRPIASDINPLSEILVQPRLDPPTFEQVRARLRSLSFGRGCPTNE